MRGPTHVIGALALALLAGRVGLMDVVPASLGAAAVGGLLPDIDHPGSTLGRRFVPLAVIARQLGGHRGPTHSPVAVVGVFLACHLTALSALGLPVALGMLSHLMLDVITPSGIPLLWPLTGERQALPPHVHTGGLGEVAIGAMLAIPVWLLYPATVGL